MSRDDDRHPPAPPDPTVWPTLAHAAAQAPHPINAAKPRRKPPRRRLPPEVLTDAEVRGLMPPAPTGSGGAGDGRIG